MSAPLADVAALIGSDLRSFRRFTARLDDLLSPSMPYDVFISTDSRSIACALRHELLPRKNVVWWGETPDTADAIRRALGPLASGVSPHHLHQWWRLRHAWLAMERHERSRGQHWYGQVVRLRTDMRLPIPLQLSPPSGPGSRSTPPETRIVMRGDWIFWGSRETIRIALEYINELPKYHAIGQRAYMPLPYRHMLSIGPDGLSAGLHGWLKFPLKSPTRPFGFTAVTCCHIPAFIAHVREHLEALERFDASGDALRLKPHEVISNRDGWWRWDGIPDNEKYFFYHVLNRSLTPMNMIDAYNRGARAAGERVSFKGKANGLLMPERHHPDCSCLCNVSTHVAAGRR